MIKAAKYIWVVTDSGFTLDIRRYAFSHQEAISQVVNPPKNWTLYKLTKVNKRKAK